MIRNVLHDLEIYYLYLFSKLYLLLYSIKNIILLTSKIDQPVLILNVENIFSKVNYLNPLFFLLIKSIKIALALKSLVFISELEIFNFIDISL